MSRDERRNSVSASEGEIRTTAAEKNAERGEKDSLADSHSSV